MTQPIINLHLYEYTQTLHYYQCITLHYIVVNLDKCVKSCNTLNDLI